MATILIVDDDTLQRSLVTALLEPAGHEIHEARSAEEGLQAARALRPDLVLADVSLPGMSGLDLARTMKADPELRRIAVIALTGYAMREDEIVARRAGCDGYLAKPVLGAALRAEVDRLVGGSRSGSL